MHKMRYDDRAILTAFADKVAVKEWISEQLGKEYVVPNYKVLNSEQELNFSEYPREFVLKPSHASSAGFLVYEGAERNQTPLKYDHSTWGPYYRIHPDDLSINEEFIRKKSALWLNSVYASGIEFCYGPIPPLLIVEEYLQVHLPSKPNDFRLYVFHGKVKFFRMTAGAANDIPAFAYDELGNPLNIRGRHDEYDLYEPHPALPEQYLDMIKMAEKLSQGIDFVRLDFYLVSGQIYFSEITNYPLSGGIGFLPESFDKLVSSYWKSFDVCNFKESKFAKS